MFGMWNRVRQLSSSIFSFCAAIYGFSALVVFLMPRDAQALQFRYSVVVSGGGTFLTQPSHVTNNWGAGWMLSAALQLDITPRLRAGFEVAYSKHESDNEARKAEFRDIFPNATIDGFDLQITSVVLTGEYDLVERGSTKPYVRGGFGIYRVDTTDLRVSGAPPGGITFLDPSDTAFGGLLGAGVRTPIGVGTDLFIEASYHVAATEGDAMQFLPVRIGVSF